ncbi:carboxyl-terminal-processing peptidase 1, chloroplastic [Dorcoceras hygrometricum]|uniref:Carboxyl-terminal-processing peptidase 1, chloroplastic n=1 Tax=Dorcoceras hygrometricum TaxID=472368 RepID=A0A2Z7CVJ4_9LAMI|nr:carboxyl-terminal-processing peptidase 1, chloroplastic [Dorcoceras hygrometricum]
MTAIHFGIKVNWSNIIFEVLKEMVDRTTKRAKGFAAQICVLLKSDPAVTLGEAKTFPPLKILSAKTANTYVTTNKTIDSRGETDEPEVAKDVYRIVTLMASRRLAPTSFTRKPALQTVGGGRSSIRSPESRFLRQSALEDLTDSGTDGNSSLRDTATVGPQSLWLRNHNFGLAQRIMVKRLATSPHDPLGITDSACKNHLVVVSVQYGPFNTYIPIRSMTIGKSRVARDPIAMHTSWRSNSDIASITSIGYPRMRASGESSTTKHRLLHASGPHPIPPPNDPKGGNDKKGESSSRSRQPPPDDKSRRGGDGSRREVIGEDILA